MKVRCDARANSLDLHQSSDSITVESIKRQRESGRNQREKPPTLPQRWKNSERDGGGTGTDCVIRVDGAHEKPVTTRGKPVGHTAPFGRRAPILVGAFDLVLVAKHVSRREAQADEINLQLVLIYSEIGQKDFGFVERRNKLA